MRSITTPQELRTLVESLRAIDLTGWEITDVFAELDTLHEILGDLLRSLEAVGRLPDDLAKVVAAAVHDNRTNGKAVYWAAAGFLLREPTNATGVIESPPIGASEAYLSFRRRRKIVEYRDNEADRLGVVVNCLLELNVLPAPDNIRCGAIEPGETTLADAAESSLKGVSMKLFRRLRQNQRFVSFDTLRADVWGGKSIQDRGIETAIERLNTALLDTRFTVEKNAERAKLTGM